MRRRPGLANAWGVLALALLFAGCDASEKSGEEPADPPGQAEAATAQPASENERTLRRSWVWPDDGSTPRDREADNDVCAAKAREHKAGKFQGLGVFIRCMQEFGWQPVVEGKPLPVKPRTGILAETKKYSQNDEELVIRDFFQDRRDGFFLDVGCAWPKKASTTYYLEKHLGWSGIGIDALPDYREDWEKERPASKFFNLFVSDHSDTTQTFYRAGARGLSSAEKDRVFRGRKLSQQEITVPTVTLNKLLDDNQVKKVDFLSMDIEGAEIMALKGFDVERFAPELVCIEASPDNREKILEYFTSHGYERLDRYLAHDRVNWYFTPKES